MKRNTITEIKQQGRTKEREYFDNFFKGDETKPWFNETNNSRHFITWINRMRANHYNLNVSLERVGYISSARCSCGYEREHINHLVFDCIEYDDIRCELNFIEQFESIKASKLDCVWNWLKKKELKTLVKNL